MALARPHPRPFQDKRRQSQDMGTPQRRRRMKRGFGRLALSAYFTASPRACSPPGTPPAETPNTKPYHGCHAKLAWPAPVSGALFGAIRGSTRPPSHLSLARPCNYRRFGRASHTSSPATPCLGALGPQRGHMEGDGAHCSGRAIVDMRPMRGCQTPYSRSSTPDLWAWGNVA